MSQKEIHIGMNGSMLDNKPTGTGIYSFNIINNLSDLQWGEHRCTFTVFTPTHSNLSEKLQVIKLSDLLQSSRFGKVAALTRFLWNTFCYPFQGRRFDLLISPTTHGSFLSRNQIITIHDLISLRYSNISAHQRFYFKYLLPFIVSRARLIVTVSETSKRDIVHFLKCPEDKIRVIHNGYDHTHYCRTEEKGDRIDQAYGVRNYLLAVGPTYPHKNFEILIDAYASLDDNIRKEHPLVIAGGMKTYVSKLKEQVHHAGLDGDIHFLGYVPFECMPSLYREAALLVFPSLYEGFGIPLLEAMACGCPVIVSETSSMPEVCGDAAMYVDPTSKEAISKAIGRLLCDANLREGLRQKGFERAKQFSWKQAAESFKTIIENQLQITKLN
ncbi:MAG TPA: glycosyltransferase family 1 protein [Puia sp.]|nr:glycosyltransferase family 1 protein [Puia sp.]